jgi:chromosome segregation ATPase
MINYSEGGKINPAKFLEYIAKQFPVDLANMIKTRDELALRQGSVNAAKNAVADRQKAADELVAARTEADTLRAGAKAVNEAAAKKKKELDERETTLNAKQETLNVLNITRTEVLDKQQKELEAKAQALADERLKLDKLAEALNAERQDFDARAKAFQDRVASLSL